MSTTPMDRLARFVVLSSRLRKHPRRDDRLGRPPLDEGEGHQRGDPDREHADAGDRQPRPLHAALEQAQHQQRGADGQQRGAAVVDPVLGLGDVLV